MIRPPTEPAGSGRDANWLRFLTRFTRRLRLIDSPTVRVEQLPDGQRIHVKAKSGGGGGTTEPVWL